MRKSLFRKYFMVTVTIVGVSFAVMASILMILVTDFWKTDKRASLKEGAYEASAMAKALLAQSFSAETVALNMRVVANVLDADIYIVSPSGELFISSRLSDSGLPMRMPVPEKLVEKAMSGEFNEVGNLGGVFSSPHYTVGVPFFGSESKPVILGAVFASSPSYEISRFTKDLLNMFLIAGLLVILVVFFAVYEITRRMTLPLRQMAAAAGAMANGDFSRRISVNRDDEIGELAHSFNEMTVSLASLEQMRRSFIGNISHELKTPMTTIAGFIDGILDGTIESRRQSQYLSIVSDEIKRLSRLVTSMLSLSKLEAGEMKLNPAKFDLSEILFRTMLSLEHRINEKEIEVKGLDSVGHVEIMADPDLIHQVIYNLLDNAVKFTPKNGIISVKVDNTPYEMKMTVRNTGKGVEAVELPHIFERFYKGDKSRSMDKTGTGLGLYIVKTIIGIHSGHITARSVVDEYTEFEFTLPRQI